MIKIIPIISNNMGSNSFVIIDEKICVIDPGFNAEFGVGHDKVDIVINTHSHYDHVANNHLFNNAIFYMHEKEIPYANSCCGTLEMFQSKYNPQAFIKIPNKISLGKIELKVIHTPGHTPGSICLLEKESKSLISGDAIFADGIGRFDLSKGSLKQTKETIKKISEIDFEHLLPGHGYLGNKDSAKFALKMINGI